MPYLDKIFSSEDFDDPDRSALGATPQYTYLVMKNLWYTNNGLSNKELYERCIDIYVKDANELSRLKTKTVTNQRESILAIVDSGFRVGNPVDPEGAQYENIRPAFIETLDEIDDTFGASTKLLEKALRAAEKF